MAVFKEFYLPSTTGKNNLHVLKCLPENAPRAIVQIAHGVAEHADRYRDFMAYLADNGIASIANDHLGHGKSITIADEQGFFAESNGWDHVVSDMKKLKDQTKPEFPDIPYIFFGHSMGSFLTRTYMIKYPGDYDAAIISGTGHLSPVMINGGQAISGIVARIKGRSYASPLIDNVAFGSYNKGFESPRTKFDWLSRDEEVVDKYIADPLCGFIASTGLFNDMMQGMKVITKQENIDKMDKTKPVLFISGDKDPVGENGKTVEKAYKAFCNAGLKDVYMKLYPGGRHEMLNEINKEEVYSDVLNWINSKI